jgi:hypothetical protein
MIALAIASTLAVGLGILPMPYAYYVLLRIVLCISAAVGFRVATKSDDSAWSWTYGVAALLYNPIFPVHMGSKMIWLGLNAATVVVFWLGATRFRGRPSGRGT